MEAEFLLTYRYLSIIIFNIVCYSAWDLFYTYIYRLAFIYNATENNTVVVGFLYLWTNCNCKDFILDVKGIQYQVNIRLLP